LSGHGDRSDQRGLNGDAARRHRRIGVDHHGLPARQLGHGPVHSIDRQRGCVIIGNTEAVDADAAKAGYGADDAGAAQAAIVDACNDAGAPTAALARIWRGFFGVNAGSAHAAVRGRFRLVRFFGGDLYWRRSADERGIGLRRSRSWLD